jgi:chaperonin GroEL
LAIAIGAVFVSRESGLTLKTTKLEHLGTAKTVEISKGWTIMVGGNGDLEQVDKRIDNLKAEIDQTDSLNECERIQERITRLASGIAIIRVGGATEIEMVEKRHRIEDALEAVKSAQEEGIVPGGATVLIRVTENLDVELENEDQQIGKNIILEAALAPIKQMAKNSGESPDIIADLVKNCESDLGYDFKDRKLVNMIESGIIDPAKVARCALQNAASAATTLITTNYAIIEA